MTAISPNTGTTAGGAPITLSGSGFKTGAAVTLDGTVTIATVNSSALIVATAPAHAPGTVDVVVTNPDGESSTLTRGFTYRIVQVPPPAVTTIFPNVGSTSGFTSVKLSGSGFQAGATIVVDGVEKRLAFQNSTTVYLESWAHAPGTVDVVVTNPDGQSHTVVGGYTYAPPSSFDFNGTWEGGDHETPIRFTIRDNVLTSVACGTSATFTFSVPPAVTNGEFSMSRDDGIALSGAIVSASSARGTINIPGTAFCAATPWRADKR